VVSLILVVDDERFVNDLVRLLLENEGYQVVSAFTGKEAIEMVKCHKPKTIILDIGLPELNGIEVIKRIKKILPEINIIVTTGFRDFSLEEEANSLGISKYIYKPFSIKELIEAVRRVHNN
jgi:CheY-like chemotaxis protein